MGRCVCSPLLRRAQQPGPCALAPRQNEKNPHFAPLVRMVKDPRGGCSRFIVCRPVLAGHPCICPRERPRFVAVAPLHEASCIALVQVVMYAQAPLLRGDKRCVEDKADVAATPPTAKDAAQRWRRAASSLASCAAMAPVLARPLVSDRGASFAKPPAHAPAGSDGSAADKLGGTQTRTHAARTWSFHHREALSRVFIS